jgi:hypothetical protein
VIELRANEGDFSDIAANAKALMAGLARAIRPDSALWLPIWTGLHRSIDEAFESALPRDH